MSAACLRLRCRLGNSRGPYLWRSQGLSDLTELQRTTHCDARMKKRANTFDRRAFRAGAIGAVVATVLVILGSRNLRDFDWALATYAVGSIFAVFAVVYRYAVWAQRPPTRMYLRRGLQAFLSQKRGRISAPRNAGTLFRLLLDNFVLQRFITRRGWERWVMHACLSWGGMLAFAVTFPLVFGWVHFESMPGNAEFYQVFVMGFAVDQFAVHSVS